MPLTPYTPEKLLMREVFFKRKRVVGGIYESRVSEECVCVQGRLFSI